MENLKHLKLTITGRAIERFMWNPVYILSLEGEILKSKSELLSRLRKRNQRVVFVWQLINELIKGTHKMVWERAGDRRTCPERLLMHGNQMSELCTLQDLRLLECLILTVVTVSHMWSDTPGAFGLQYFIWSHKCNKMIPAQWKMSSVT